jgi:transcription antitermination factor NusG
VRMHVHQWPWFAVRVRTGEEKTARLLLENHGYQCYLPLSKYSRYREDRVKQMEAPLFPGYLFCRMNPHDRLPVLTTPGVIQIVGVGETAIPVDEDELTAIQRAENSGLPTMAWPYLRAGHLERVEQGPLCGLTGIVVRMRFRTKLVLSVNLLQRSVAVEIDRHWVPAARRISPFPNQAHSSWAEPSSFAVTPETMPERQ